MSINQKCEIGQRCFYESDEINFLGIECYLNVNLKLKFWGVVNL